MRADHRARRTLRDVMGERAPPCPLCHRHHDPAVAPHWAGLADNTIIIANSSFPLRCQRAAIGRIAFELRRRRTATLGLRREVRRLRAQLRAARADKSPKCRRHEAKA